MSAKFLPARRTGASVRKTDRTRRHLATFGTVAVLTAGCTAEGQGAASTPSARTTAPVVSPTRPAPFDGDPAAEVWRTTDLQVKRATSFHVVLKSYDKKKPVAMDLSLGRGSRAVGTVTLGGQKVDIRRIGKDLWFRANRTYWTENRAPEFVTRRVAGRWVQVRKGRVGFDTLFELTSMSLVRDRFVSAPGTSVRYTGVAAGRTIGGRRTARLTGRAQGLDGGRYTTAMYIPVEGPRLPLQYVALSRKKYQGESYTYSAWNTKVTVTRPAGAIRLP